MHVDNHDPRAQHTPKGQQSDESRDVAAGPAPAPVPTAIGGHHQVLREDIEHAITLTLLWLLSVTKVVSKILMYPISFALAAWLLMILTSHTSFIGSSGIDALSPLCSIPLLSVVPICKSRTSVQEPRYLELVELQTRFESVMESAGFGTGLALGLKKSEMAVGDLTTVVQLSGLVSKNLLARSLDDFVGSAREAGWHLSRLESGVGGAVDSILAMDDYTIRSLEAIEHNEKTRSVMSAVIYPFSPSPGSRKKLIETFNQAVDLMDSNLQRLIEVSVGTTSVLSQLESQLMVIREVVSREEGDTNLRRDEVLADLWTRVGGNRAQLAKFDGHSSLLSQAASYRSAAASQVSGMLIQLRKLAAELGDLRQRTARPLLSHEESIPLEDYIAALRKGAQRLSEGRRRAKRKEEQILKNLFYGAQYPELVSR